MPQSTYRLSRPATAALRPLIDLSTSRVSSPQGCAVLHWLTQDHVEQWGALQIPEASLRRLLRRGGVELTDQSARALASQHPKWLRFLAVPAAELTLEEQLYYGRLLIYLGFVNDAEQLASCALAVATDSYLTAWASYILHQVEVLRTPLRWNPRRLAEDCKVWHSGWNRATFQLTLLSIAYYLESHVDLPMAATCLDKGRRCLAEGAGICDDPRARTLAHARLLRHEAQYAWHRQAKEEAERALAAARSLIAEQLACIPSVDVGWRYLLHETEQALLGLRADYAWRSGELELALTLTQEIVAKDPDDARALLNAGELAGQLGRRELAGHFLGRAAFCGVVERADALCALSAHAAEGRLREVALVEAIETSLAMFGPALPPRFDERIRRQLQSLGNPQLHRWFSSLPVSVNEAVPVEGHAFDNDCRRFADSARKSAAAWDKALSSSEVYSRFRSFWELSADTTDSHFLNHIPIVAWEALQQRKQPWFESIYVQRRLMLNFREELFHGCMANLVDSQEQVAQGIGLAIVRGRSVQLDAFLDEVASPVRGSSLRRALLGRLLIALGFYDEATRMILPPDPSTAWSLEDEYLACTMVTMRMTLARTSRIDVSQECRRVFAKLSSRAETLLIRLNLALAACVYHGHRKEADRIAPWRAAALTLLREVEACPSISDFEKNFAQSRAYRAVSFHPFLCGDWETLRSDAEVCERAARSCEPRTAHQHLLKIENLTPMLETTSRIYSVLGDHDRAAALMEQIVAGPNSEDTKAWIQIGDLRAKRGDLKGATDAFLAAARIGIPHGRIAWHRAGWCFEQSGEPDEAIRCYLRSLRSWPKGVSPLLRILAVSRAHAEPLLTSWAEDALAAMQATGRLGNKISERLAGLLSNREK